MIKIVIIEDEIPARKKIKRFLAEMDESVSVIAELGTVNEAIEFLGSAEEIDLILSDIELQDGNAFEIYSQVTVSCPIIFTTAYNQFLMNAFESNGIEYLLKPFSIERFRKAWEKFLMLRKSTPTDSALVSRLEKFIAETASSKRFKKRFSVNSSKGIYFVETNEIVYFMASEGVIFAFDNKGRRHILSYCTLKEIEEIVDSMDFFRINRSELVHKKYIERIERYSKNTLAIKMEAMDKNLITSQSNTSSFREWLEM
jgi:DNA-binding LytR/AlgR family response regulator